MYQISFYKGSESDETQRDRHTHIPYMRANIGNPLTPSSRRFDFFAFILKQNVIWSVITRFFTGPL